ncbi:MAG: hypothetical protein QXX64_01720 [Nitrososphaera sp.]|uniref:Polyketide cyclase/dehydrase n=1 Tax=Nitrososphaera gargensis (strain Ga9.2) TaxID=1237085 RepID=K0IF09_NITGG|nr:hypothetical protein [Candidatus Nitrososphaera gargensis]AFU57388.1 hypothetical protein Ngar_c04410 [Candidatus Nitrososphaera gargensis Ga9.2]
MNRSIDDVFDFFNDPMGMEIGGAAKSVTKDNDGSWTFDHSIAGESRIKHAPIREAGVLDHVFTGEGLEWNVYVRMIPNYGGTTVVWTFVKPDGLSDEQFGRQLRGFDPGIILWKQALEGGRN